MEQPLAGGCMCGAVRYEITCEPTSVYACYCTDCQRATTSAFYRRLGSGGSVSAVG